MNVTLKNVPEAIYRVIKREAEENGRSLNTQIIHVLQSEAAEVQRRKKPVYLALVIEHNCPLVTADRRLFRGAVARHPSVRLLP